MDRSSPTDEDWPQEGTFCTLKLLKKADGTELQRYPVDGERTTFGRDPSNDVRIYYPDISRFQCELVFDVDRKPFLKVLGKTGLLINGKQVKPPAEVELKEGDTFEMRKKRWLLCLPSDGTIQAMKQVEVSTPRRRRPSTRFSIIPPDLTFSPYAAHDAAARLPASPIGSLKGLETQSSTQSLRRPVPESLSSQDGEEVNQENDGRNDSSEESSEQEQVEDEKSEEEASSSKSTATRIRESIWMPRRFSNSLPGNNKDADNSQTASSILQPSLSDTQLDTVAGSKRKSRAEEEEETEVVSHQQATPRSIPLPVSLETPYASADGTPIRKPLMHKTPSSTAGRTPHSSAKAPSNNRSSLYPALPPAPISYRTAQHPTNTPISTSSVEQVPDEFPPRHDSPTSISTEISTPQSPEVHSVPLPSIGGSSVKQLVAPSTPGAVMQQTPKNLTATKGPNSLRKAILMRSARKVLFGQKEEPVVVKDQMIGNVKIRRRSSTGPGNQDVFDDLPAEPVSSIFDFEPDSESSDEEEETDIDKENEPTEDVNPAAAQAFSVGLEDEEHSDRIDERDSVESPEEEYVEDNLLDEDVSDEDSSDEDSSEIKPMDNYADQEVSIGSIGESESDDEAFEEVEKNLIVELSSGSESEEEQKPDLRSFKIKKEETSLDDILPPGPSTPTILRTPQAARPIQTRFYTPQAVSSADFKVNLSRNLGPPVQVPASASKPRSLNALSKVWKEEAGRRSSLGPPLRVQRVRTVEEDVDEETKDEQEALRKAAAKRRESAIILASAPRQLPKISEFDMKDLQSPRKKPLGTPLAIPELNDSSSDEERTPLQLLAKKAEKLKRKSMARHTLLGATPFSPSAPGTPLRASTLLTSTPKSILNQSSVPLLGSPNLQPSRLSARPEPPTPNMGGLRHLFSTSSAVPSTPRFGGMRSLFREPIAESPSTSYSEGVESIFQLSEETGSLFSELPSVVRPLASRDELLSLTEEPLGQETAVENPDESLLIVLEDSLLDLEQAADFNISGAVTDHKEIHGDDAENDKTQGKLQDKRDQIVGQDSTEHLIDVRSTTTSSSNSVSITTGIEVVDEHKSGSTITNLPRPKTRQTSARSTTTAASESESLVDSSRPDVSSPIAPPSPPRTRRATSRAASEQPATTTSTSLTSSSVSVSRLPARRTTRAASVTPSVSSAQAPVKPTRSAGMVRKGMTPVLTLASQEQIDSKAIGSKTRSGRVPVSSTTGNMGSRVVSVKTEPIELETLEEDEDILEIETPPAPSSRARSTKMKAATTAAKGKNPVRPGVAALELRPNREDDSSLPVIKKRRTTTNSSIEDDKENETAKPSNRLLDNSSDVIAIAKSALVSKLVPPKPVGRTTRARTATAEPEEQVSEKATAARTNTRTKK
ncbi:SMAD/FHA domain [Phaffia rhodozyma]|uniref:SMAD/FHA domain n=1 Tax=Phaffia rhodozyma TaxID=264483 RepID=A0A0F7SRP3_PHARH|nr:SMAD/FHA domain [Phaffia rhodozyma]